MALLDRFRKKNTIKEPPAAERKYEVGTALNPEQVYRSYDTGEIFEVSPSPSTHELTEMVRNDAQARQLFSAVTLPLRQARFEIVATEGDKGERDFVEWCLLRGMTTPFREVLAGISNAVLTRQAFFEKVWKVQPDGRYRGKVVLHKLGYRPPTTCTIKADENGSFAGFIQRAYKGTTSGRSYIERSFSPQRSYVYVFNAAEAPLVGRSPFEVVYKIYRDKRKVMFFYFAFLENVAFPRTIVSVDSDDPEELARLIQKARKLGANGIMGKYAGESIESYESQRTTRDYQTALEYLDWQMAKALLAQFLDLGTSGERGSYALSQDKSSFFFKSLQTFLDDVADSIERYIIRDLIDYNFGPGASYPKVRFQPLDDDTADAVMDVFKSVIMSATPNVTPPFLLKLMQRVSDIAGLDLDPMEELNEEALEEIRKTIPTAREEMESREERAGAGQNPVTGLDRNRNNKLPRELDALQARGVGIDRPDNKDIQRDPIPRPPSPIQRKEDEDDEE